MIYDIIHPYKTRSNSKKILKDEVEKVKSNKNWRAEYVKNKIEYEEPVWVLFY